MIEPIAEVFGVSILEIMRSEKINEQPIPMESATEAINNVMDVVAYQRKIEKTQNKKIDPCFTKSNEQQSKHDYPNIIPDEAQINQ